MPVVQKTDGKETYSFPIDGRERYVQVMVQAGYVEMVAFEGKESAVGYWCRSCPAMIESKASSTGYWCRRIGFEDKPWGCCSSWHPFPKVQKIQDNLV